VPRGLRAVYQPELTLQSLDLISDKLFDYEILLFHTEDEKDLAESYLNKFKTLNINLVEFLPPKELWEILASSTLVIMNPLHDGTPNSALESMILKTPVIIGACEYDTSIFNDQTVNKLRNNDKSELAELVLASLDSYPEEKLNAAYNAVKMNATQSIEMRKVKSLYDQLSH
jgi:glycosyltransferase involved in cell wall biosynthesis